MSCHIGFLNAVLASALTARKQKARSACAVRAADGRTALYAMLVSFGASLKRQFIRSIPLQERAHCRPRNGRVNPMMQAHSDETKPIGRLVERGGGCISSRMAS